MDIKKIAFDVSKKLSEHSPVILTGIAVGGVVTTTVLAVKAVPKAQELINKAYIDSMYKDRGSEAYNLLDVQAMYPTSKLDTFSKTDIIKIAWRPFVPAALMGTMTIACIIGATAVQYRRNAALAGLYSLTETTLKEYQSKVVDTIGESKEKDIRSDISQDRLKSTVITEDNVLQTGNGDTLFFDSLSGRYFKSDMESVRSSVNDFNEGIIHGWSDTLNSFYDALQIPSTELGRNIGWTTESLLEINYTSKVAENGKPCIVMEYQSSPVVV